jgi:uncharacterized protein (UPF0261 family)
MPEVILIATFETKAEELAFLRGALESHGLSVHPVDISLGARGEVWDGETKIASMQKMAIEGTASSLALLAEGAAAIVGLGGGTGGEMILQVMKALPHDFPKFLITTLPFDPRPTLADTSIVLVPTLADICGLNSALRTVLKRSAAMVAGLAALPPPPPASRAIGITTLGATQAGADQIAHALRTLGHECMLFHANGYGGAAFARYAAAGAFHAVIDLNCHELTRMMLAGAHVPMPTRFTAAGMAGAPQLVLPGALNFIGLGEIGTLSPDHLARPHYRHSGLFTHVKLLPEEMARMATALAANLNASPSPTHLIVPMGGFSHQDAPGGAIEDPHLRHVFLDCMRRELGAHVQISAIEAHINHPDTAAAVVAALAHHLAHHFAQSDKVQQCSTSTISTPRRMN